MPATVARGGYDVGAYGVHTRVEVSINMDARSTGLLVAAAGVLLVVAGLVMAAGGLGWFGRLPGDLRLGSGGMRVYVPFASMLLVSLVLTIVAAVLRRLLP